MYTVILTFFESEPCLCECGEMLNGDFRSESRILLHKSGELFYERSSLKSMTLAISQTFKKLLIDKCGKLLFTGRGSFNLFTGATKKTCKNNVDWSGVAAHDVGFRYDAANHV